MVCANYGGCEHRVPIPRVWVAKYCAANCGHTDITLLSLELGKENTNSYGLSYNTASKYKDIVHFCQVWDSWNYEGPRPIQL